MAARRLASTQPESFAFSEKTRAEIEWWLGKYPKDRRQSAVIPVLWLVQQQEGWVSEPAIRATAQLLGMPIIRVLEVATFYTMFQLHPVGRHHLQLCGTSPCVLRGAEALKDVCRRRIGAPFAVTADGLLSWEEMECLGACVNAPVVAIDGYYHEDLAPETLEARIDALIAGAPMAPGSATGREASAPQGPSATLLDPALYDGSLAQPIVLPNKPAAA